MILRQLFDPESSTYTYILGDAGVAAVIDPVLERTDDIVKSLKADDLKLLYTLETHVHADHVTGGGRLREDLGAKICLPAKANACECADVPIAQGDTITVGGLIIQVIETPGHTPDHVCYYVPAQKMVFTGDTLLVGTCGRTDFQGGNAGALFDSIHSKLFALPDDVVVYPGHDYKGNKSTTILAEKQSNARAVGRTREAFIELMNGLHLPPPKRIAEAIPANLHCGVPHA